MAKKKPSIEELRAKAESGDMKAMRELTKIFEGGPDYDIYEDNLEEDEYTYWLEKLSESGDTESTYSLSMYYEEGSQAQIDLLLKAIAKDKVEAFFDLAKIFKDRDDYEAAIQLLLRLLSLKNIQSYTISRSTYEIGNLYESKGSVEDYENAIVWYEKSADWGNWMAARRLGEIFQYGVIKSEYVGNGHIEDTIVVNKSYARAARWYLKAAQIGQPMDWSKMSSVYYEGELEIKNYAKAFYWMLKAATGNIDVYAKDLAECFEQGIVVEQNYYEAYTWALMAKRTYDRKRRDDLEKKLSRKEIDSAQFEATYRINSFLKHNHFLYSPVLFDYMLGKLNLVVEGDSLQPKTDKPPNEPKDTAESSEQIKKPITKSVPELAETDDPDPTSSIAYSYLSVCKKHFNPELVTLELVVPRKLKKTESMDFARLRISYSGKDTDAKNISTLIPFRVNKAERRLLVILSAQSSIADGEKRAESVRKILAEHKNKERVSHLNAMFRAIFPGCAKTRGERMINRQSGYIAPTLKIDTTKIINARDYPLCGL